ncbi:MAG: glycerophosphodiester phosphodiesterase family protein [Phycisphaerales bacterium]
MKLVLALLLLVSVVGCAKHRATERDPIVIAHRGASAYEPEHTMQAYRLALDMGADYIEPDIVFTRDLVAICAHDLTMEQTTDVEQRFPDRARPDGSWYWIDFDLSEVKTLNKHGRSAEALAGENGPYRVVTLRELIDTVQAEHFRRMLVRPYILGASKGPVGIVPELKKPGFYKQHASGFDSASALTEELRINMYVLPELDDLVMIQCFDLDTIEHLATLSDLPLIWLTSEDPTDEQLDRAAAVAHGLGPNRRLLEDDAGNPKPLIERARSRSLALYPYTFKNEQDAMERFLHEHRVEGLFTDNPDVGVRAKRLPTIR